jgi:hypothetical protein
MSELSEVSILFGQHVSDIERARDIFTAETRRFVSDLLENINDERSGPWSSPKLQIKTKDGELENEEKITGFLSRQFAMATLPLCFKMRVKYMPIAEIHFGIEFEASSGSFNWRVRLIPSSRHQWLDEVIWGEWQKTRDTLPSGAKHEAKEGIVVFISRRFAADLNFKSALEDIQNVLKFIMASEAILVTEFGKQLVEDSFSQ